MKTLKSTFSHDSRSCVCWKPDATIDSILLIVHGMTEHIQRYEALAEQLTQHHILVTGFDLKGHGTDAGDPMCASFDENGWEGSCTEIKDAARKLKQTYPNLPLYIMGFSLGSFLVRDIMAHQDTVADGFILAGTGDQPSLVLNGIQLIVKGQIKKAGFNQSTPLIQSLSFGTYNQKFKPNRTESDWLCSDETQLDLYIHDPLCRPAISSGLFYQLLEAMKRTGSLSHIRRYDPSIPILLISGKDDPVGDQGKGVSSLYQKMIQAGLSAELHLFDHARHDLFHELNSGAAKQATETLISFLKK